MRILLLALTLAALAACGQSPQVHTLSGSTMGTTWSAQVVAMPDEDMEAVRREIEQALELVNAQMSTYRDDSALSRFNQAEAGDTLALPEEFAHVLQAALTLAEESGGAYDPTVGPLVNLWGFGPDGPRDRAPGEDAVAEALERVGWHRLRLDADRRRLTQPGGAYLDLSSIAKGYGVDLVAERLEARGIEAYLVDIGGDMRLKGPKPDGTPWRIGIERPGEGRRVVHSIIEPGDRAVATSGSYRNFFREGDREYSHTIDPHTGYPVPSKLVSVTVLHDNCMKADALATAITALGPDEGYAFARERDLAVLLLVLDNGSVQERMTPAFSPYLSQGTD
ncbi:MAG: FAD:protein FMN transferase [Ectothiorhodospiraceae bacterium]|nr:FAD:protein FMN transferase [Ectothiorhodospiraceae bacterium]